MPDQEFLRADALRDAKRMYELLTERGAEIVDALTPAAAAAPEVLALAGLDQRFVTASASLPRAPTTEELAVLPAGQSLFGAHNPDGWQRVEWDRVGSTWVPRGDRTATGSEVQAVDAAVTDTRATLTVTRAQLASGALVMPADATRIWDEYTSLLVRAAGPGETPNLVTTYVLSGGRIAEREGVGSVSPRWAGAAPGVEAPQDAAWRAAGIVAAARGCTVDGEGLTYVLSRCEWRRSDLLDRLLLLDNALILSDVTGGGTDLTSPFVLNGYYIGAGPITREKLESARISNVTFGPRLRVNGRRELMTDIDGSGQGEDGGRCGVSVYGRASNITFQGAYDNCATDGVQFYAYTSRSSELADPAEQDADDFCFLNIVWDGAKARGNRRHAGSSESAEIRFIGDYALTGNGFDLPGVTPGTDAHSGLRGAPYNGTLYGCGWDFEAYDWAGNHRRVYMADTGTAEGNAGASILLWIPANAYQSAKFKAWDNLDIRCALDAGPYASGNGALIVNLPAGIGVAGKYVATNVNLAPVRLNGVLTAQYCEGTFTAGRATAAGPYWSNLTASRGIIMQPSNTTTLRPYVESGNLRLDGILPDLSALPTLSASGHPVTITPTSGQVTSRENGVYRITLTYSVTPTGAGTRTTFTLNPATFGEQVVALSAGAIDNNDGATRIGVQYGAANTFDLSWAGSGALHILGVQVVMRVRYGASS